MSQGPDPAISTLRRFARTYGVALASVAGATAARLLLQPLLGGHLQFITYYPAVFLSAAVGGFGPALMAVAASALLAELLFFPPTEAFSLGDPVAVSGVLLFTLGGAGVAWLGETRLRALARARREASEATHQKQRAEQAALSARQAAAQAGQEAARADEESARAREALQEAHAAHERVQAVLDSTTDAYLGLSPDWRITVANRQAAATLRRRGVDLARLTSRTVWEIWPDLAGTEAEREYRRVMAERTPSTFEHWYPAYESWYETHAYPTPDGGIGVFFHDVTARKQAETQLRDTEQTYRTIAELSPDAILVKQDRCYVYANHAAASLCGAASQQDLIGRTPYEFLDGSGGEIVRERVRQVLDDHVAAGSVQCRWQRLDGTISEVELAAAPLTWRGRPAVQLAIRDISERKRLDERLQQAQRMDAVGRLAGGVAHEVNNQMTVVLGTTEFLLRRPDLPGWARADVDAIRRAAQSSAAVTGQLLSFGRRQLLHLQPLDLNAVVLEIAPILQRAVGSMIQVECRLQPDPAIATVDHAQLRQALLNLALNARDAMTPSGGVLLIQTSSEEVRPGNSLDFGAEALPGSYVALRVKDSGAGMDAVTMSRVFEPFFTTKPIGQGTGLGLAMVYGLVRQSQGYVTLESQPGTGSTFTIYLPRSEMPVKAPAAPAPPPVTSSEVDRPAAGLAVVVEDEASVRDVVVRVLQEEGFRVVEAANGAEALDHIGRTEPGGELRLVVTDLAMPVMGGRELAERFRGMGHQVPLLFISGYTDDDIARLGLLADGEDVLRKPFSPTVLLERVRQLTGSRKAQEAVNVGRGSLPERGS